MAKYCMICGTWRHNAKGCPTCTANHKARINRDWELAYLVPELLDALEDMLFYHPESIGASKARAAIAKAKGVTTNA